MVGEGVRFAVAAPRSVEFEEDVIVIIYNKLLVVLGHNDLDGSLLLLWHRLRFHAGLDLAVNEVLNKSANVFLRDFLLLVKRELLVFDGLLDSECGPLAVL